MKKTDMLHLSFKNFKSSKIKGLLCTVSVCVGITSISLVSQIGGTAVNAIEKELNMISENATMLQSTSSVFSSEEIEAVRASDNIKAVMPYTFEYGTVFAKNSKTDALICGIDKSFTSVFNIDVIHKDIFKDSNFILKKDHVIIDDVFAKKLYSRKDVVGKTLQLSINGNVKKYKVISVISSQKAGMENLLGKSLPEIVYVSNEAISDAYGENMIYSLAISFFDDLSNTKTVNNVIRKLKINFGNGDYKAENIGSYADMAKRISNIVSLLISGIAGISVLVGGIGIMNSMVASVENRKNEIGIFMALGAYKKDIMRTFVYEAVIISVLGGIIGIGICIFVICGVNSLLRTNIAINISNMLSCFGGAVLCGMIFGFLPAKKAANLSPIDAIRWE